MEQIIKIQNGEKQSSIFSEKEMANRLSTLREKMLIEKLDIVLFILVLAMAVVVFPKILMQ